MKPFIIGDCMKPLVVKKGQIIKFDVKYGGEPEPEASWELEGKPVKIDGERYILFRCFSTHTGIPKLLKISSCFNRQFITQIMIN